MQQPARFKQGATAALGLALALALHLPGQAATFELPPLQRSHCSAVAGWTQSAPSVLSCDGDVWLAGGTWLSESAIEIRAGGVLRLSDASITAPGIELVAGSLRIDSDVWLISPAGEVRFTGLDAISVDGTVSAGGVLRVGPTGSGAIEVLPGRDIGLLPGRPNVLSPVPEPQTLALWLGGLLLLGARWLRVVPAAGRSRAV